MNKKTVIIIWYFLFKKKVLQRAKTICKIRQLRRTVIDQACRYLAKWDDIPLSWLWEDVCEKILFVQKDSAGKNFVQSLLCRPNPHELVGYYPRRPLSELELCAQKGLEFIS